MALRHTFPLSHVKTFDGSKLNLFDYHYLISVNKKNLVNKLTVRGVRPSRSVIRHERGGFNG